MIERYKQINLHPADNEVRSWARLLILALPIAGLVWTLLVWVVSGEWHWAILAAFACAGLFVGLLGHLSPKAARPLHVAWFALVATVELVVTNVLLTTFFYLVLTPVGLIMRLKGRRHFLKRPSPGAPSYWREVEPITDTKRYFRQF